MNINRSLPGWIKWGAVALITIAIIGVVFAAVLYYGIQQELTETMAETEQVLLDATSLQEIDMIEQFNGSEAFHVVYGRNGEDEEKIIFYPLEGKEKNLTTIDRSEIIPKDEIADTWKNDCNECELVQIVPALVDGEELWEITYWDKSNRYVFDYVSIYDGSPYEMYRLDPIFE
ncbi:DUF5590 domain-containing protein [Virgibacillus xinjiangensis]|uniref:DUF5590 domain-containing protein n=1 Tax=Virgibacillus xinjiangensis TaxID=393090 RepID=A0ABV7CRQ7_9BACI